MPHELKKLTPNLVVSSVERSMAFYRDVLGFTVTAINLLSGERKKISFPSPRQRGSTPPLRETCHLPPAAGKGAMYT